jgi:predicted MFS family arabinose efflux permease
VGPLVAGLGAMAVAALLFPKGTLPDYALQFSAASIGSQVSWNFCNPYQLAVIARADPSSRLIAVSASVQGAEVSLGPAVGGLLVEGDDYAGIVALSVAALLLSLLLILPAAVSQQRQIRARSEAPAPAADSTTL